jgi:hypothetical protein
MFVYVLQSATLATDFTTNGTPSTETDHMFLKPGTRNIGLQLINVIGKGAALTALTGIAFRLKKWTTTAAAGGTSQTPTPKDPGAQAAKLTNGLSASAGVTAGTGGPTFIGGCGCGGAGPGGWAAANPDSLPSLEGSATQSIDLFSSSGTASMKFEFTAEVVE